MKHKIGDIYKKTMTRNTHPSWGNTVLLFIGLEEKNDLLCFFSIYEGKIYTTFWFEKDVYKLC